MSDTSGRFPGNDPPTRPGPVVHPVPCANCGAPTDPLRAPRVAIFRERFRYFCSSECHLAFDPETRLTPLPRPRRRGSEHPFMAEPPGVTPVEESRFGARRQAAEALERIEDDGLAELAALRDGAADEPTAADEQLGAGPSGQPPVGPTPADDAEGAAEVGTLLLLLAMAGGVLAVALLLVGHSSVALSARTVVLLVACGALVAECVMRPRDPTEPHPVALLAAPAVSTGTASIARLAGHGLASSALTLAGLVVAATAGSLWLVQRARRPIDAEREQIRQLLDCEAHRVVADEVVAARATDLRPGEEILVEPGETVPADATVVAGSGQVLPWLGARVTAPRGEGDSIVAGARVVQGRLRAVVGWAGHDRAWMRLTNDPRRRADLLAPLARAGTLLAERGALLAAGLAALVAFAGDHGTVTIVMVAVAAQVAVASAGVAQIGALHVARTVLAGLRRGIAYRTAEALDRAGRVSSVAFCARGTLLLGEPEVANIEPIGPHDPHRVLALVAGAESGATHPVATAIVRAARDRDIRADGVRSPSLQPGLGVTAIASNGQKLAVGSRALMLKERISVASAEAKITELEAMGRTVMLAALDGRLVGVLGLQDGLRPGARAAVQYLLDVGVEPVLLSGDARETCDALGRALDIDHIRPEVLPADRGEEIRRLADGGAVVAVVGHSPADDSALSAADLSVALAAAGSSAAEWSVQLASDDVRDAAYAVRLAHRGRSEARLGLGITLAPGAGIALAVAFTLLPPLAAPLAAVAATLAALARLRAEFE
jgi:Cu+-exporting ATPase